MLGKTDETADIAKTMHLTHLGSRLCIAAGRKAPTAIATAKAAARRAYLCCRSDPTAGDRIWSQTLTAVEATNDAAKIAAMFPRAGLAMEITLDMRGWPQHVSGL